MTRHALSTRLWHWVNALSLVVLFMSGLNISNAHPHLYWGEWGFAPEDAWLHVQRFPGWATIPSYQDLAGYCCRNQLYRSGNNIEIGR